LMFLNFKKKLNERKYGAVRCLFFCISGMHAEYQEPTTTTTKKRRFKREKLFFR